MKSLILLGCFLTILGLASAADDDAFQCGALGDSLTEEICGVQELIGLYQEKLSLLKQMRQNSQKHPPVFRQPRHTAIPKRSGNYTMDAEFVPPGFVLSNGSLYDINGEYLQNVPGTVLTMQPGEVTTLLGKQVNIVHLKQKLSKELWGFQKEQLLTLWTMYRGERMMVQYQRNVIELTSKQVSRNLEVNTQLVSVMRTPSMLLFVCSNQFGKVNLATLEPVYFKTNKPLELRNIVSAAVDAANWQSFAVVTAQHTLYLLDVRTGNVLSQIDFSQAASKNYFTNVKVALLANHVFLHSDGSPKVLMYNTTFQNKVVEEPTLSLCPSSNRTVGATYEHKFSYSGASIYVLCSEGVNGIGESFLFEIPLPEHKVQELVPKWVQYFMIAAAIVVGIYYRKYRNQPKISVKIPQPVMSTKRSKYAVGKPIPQASAESESDPQSNEPSVAELKRMARDRKQPKKQQ